MSKQATRNETNTERLFRLMCEAYDAYRDGEMDGDDLAGAVVDYTDAVKLAAGEAERIAEALRIAREFGQIDGNHHKAWVIEQMTAALEGRPADPSSGMAP